MLHLANEFLAESTAVSSRSCLAALTISSARQRVVVELRERFEATKSSTKSSRVGSRV
jgi:hypothetical protein